MPHYQDHDKKSAYVVLFYRNFSPYGPYGDDYNYCHIGLGINALHTAKILRREGIHCDIAPVVTPADIAKWVTAHGPPTYAIIEAPWVPAKVIASLLLEFPQTHWIVRSHSQIGFLQVEPGAVVILRELLTMQEMQLNLTVAANTRRLTHFLEKTYTARCLYLPNLYDVQRVQRKRDESHTHRNLRIASFGALRLLKNHTTAAAAALLMAQRRGSDLEFWINVNREENIGSKGILMTLRAMFDHVPYAKLVEQPWQTWSEFRRTVAYMDLCLQVSFSETFNIITADAVAEGVPSVVSESIEWAPRDWHAEPDNAEDVARIGSRLLWDTHGAEEGLASLERYVKESVCIWLGYLNSNPT